MSTAPVNFTGLMSGLDSATLVDQLMYLQRKPVRDLQTRITIAEGQRSAYQEVNTKLLALKSAAEALSEASITQTKTATSSADDAITATATSATPEGVYSFRVNVMKSTPR